jgi:hypothetical protein
MKQQFCQAFYMIVKCFVLLLWDTNINYKFLKTNILRIIFVYGLCLQVLCYVFDQPRLCPSGIGKVRWIFAGSTYGAKGFHLAMMTGLQWIWLWRAEGILYPKVGSEPRWGPGIPYIHRILNMSEVREWEVGQFRILHNRELRNVYTYHQKLLRWLNQEAYNMLDM